MVCFEHIISLQAIGLVFFMAFFEDMLSENQIVAYFFSKIFPPYSDKYFLLVD